MKPGVHQYEDKLLEFAYGELPPHEASAVDSHVKGCARCTSALEQIRSVRSAMAVLPAEPVPDKGLDSLMAYAEQAARRNASAQAITPFWAKFRRFVAPLAGVTAVALVGAVYLKVSEKVDLSKERAVTESVKAKDDARKAPEATVAQAGPQAELKAEVNAPPSAPRAQAAAPAEPAPAQDIAEKPKEAEDLAAAQIQADKLEKKGVELRQRDDKEVALQTKAPAKTAAHAATKAAPFAESKKASGGWKNEERGVLGGGSASQTAQGGYGLGTGPGGLGDAVGTAERLSNSKVNKPAGGEDADLGQAFGDTAKGGKLDEKRRGPTTADDETGYVAKAPKAKPSKKKAKAVPSANEGGGEIDVPTGTLSESYDKKALAKEQPAEKAKRETQTAPAKTAQVQDFSNAGRTARMESKDAPQVARAEPQAAPQAVAQKAEPTQQLAPQPPPPVASSGAPSADNFGVRVGSGSAYRQQRQENAEESQVEQQAVQAAAPSSAAADIENVQAAKQKQLAELMKQARASTDPKEVLRLCDEIIRGDAQGDLKAEALYRSCSTYQNIGEDDAAAPFCGQLVKQFPRTKWASMVMMREKERLTRPQERAKKANKAYDEQFAPAAEPAPAKPPKATSVPADSMEAY